MQYASATVGETQAPRTLTVPSLHAHRPEASFVASRGQAATQAVPEQGARVRQPATVMKRAAATPRPRIGRQGYACYTRPAMLATFVEGTPAFEAALARLESRGEADFAKVEPVVREILAAVKAEGDEAVQRYSARFGRRAPRLVVRDYPGAAALGRLPPDAREAMHLAADRIAAFHAHEKEKGFRYEHEGVALGVRVLPIGRVGVYAPGGKARYPSSVLMAAIPARVAGVLEILLATPLAGDESDDAIYAAAHIAGVSAIVDAGGAQAIAALAYGTQSIPRVDKIVGPGNHYVACAKRLVFGAVDIDGIAGPSEILVVADDEADPRWVAADLLSQAEHDEAAYPLLVTSSPLMAAAVGRELGLQIESLPRATIAKAALANGAAFVVPGREGMTRVADRLAPEHLSLHVVDPRTMLEGIHHAGAAFLGPMTPEATGDYLAGPSHVLPTGGAVRFGSPLGVYDFVTRTSLIEYSRDALTRHGRAICSLARLEGLEAHALAVEARLHGG
jgi:histidinol dehydrogenase